jgi:hypothetical protein
VEGALDPERRGTDVKALAVRASFIVRGLAHGLLALSAAKLALGKPSSRDDEKGEQATRAAFELPAGEWIAWAAPIGIAGYGVYQLYRRRHGEAEPPARHGGDVQRGRPLGNRREPVRHRRARLVFIAIAWLVMRAAREHDSSEAGGVRDALGTLQDFGQWPFAAIAVGLIAYGGYQLLNARYRRIRVR